MIGDGGGGTAERTVRVLLLLLLIVTGREYCTASRAVLVVRLGELRKNANATGEIV